MGRLIVVLRTIGQNPPVNRRGDDEPGEPGPSGALAHLRVLDLSVFAQGAVAGQMLRDFGADVIKLEKPGVGDPGRQLSPVAPGFSAFFQPLNAGKRGAALNLAHPDGREALLRLIEGADVLVHNHSVGAMERMGLGYDEARSRNPSIIYAHGTGLGSEGPDAGRDVVDIIGQAKRWTGVRHRRGQSRARWCYPLRPPGRHVFAGGDSCRARPPGAHR